MFAWNSIELLPNFSLTIDAMFSPRLLIFASLVAAGSALYTGRSDSAACADGVVISTSEVSVGENRVLVETLACSGAPSKRGLLDRDLFHPPPPKTSTAAAPVATDVCGDICTDSCGTNGDLPPISEDCQTIYDSVTILQGSIAPGFTVPAKGVQQLTFGTCRVFFNNFSSKEITSCWTSLADEASAAGTLCFPPTQPVQSLGLCNSADSTWQIGVGHS